MKYIFIAIALILCVWACQRVIVVNDGDLDKNTDIDSGVIFKHHKKAK